MTEHQQAIDEAARKVYDYLKEHSPEVLALLNKDMTAGDVHQTTALGNQKGSKKLSFAEALQQGKKAKQPIAVPDDGVVSSEAAFKHDDAVEWELPLTIRKIDPEQQVIFGWASVSMIGGEVVVDKQNDMILIEDLEKAAYDYVLYCRTQGDMHKQGENGVQPVGRMIESTVYTPEKYAKCGLLAVDPVTKKQIFGWWVGFKVDDQNLWAMHKRGERPEFSIGGKGKRVNV